MSLHCCFLDNTKAAVVAERNEKRLASRDAKPRG